MKTVLLFYVSVFTFSQTPAQPPVKTLTGKEYKTEEENRQCVFTPKFSSKARLKKYPFYKTSKIQLVSFDPRNDSSKIEKDFYREGLPTNMDSVCIAEMKEIVTINFLQTDRLTEIFYNYEFKGWFSTLSNLSCYIPRNGILFFDSTGRIFEFIEICFQCEKHASWKKPIEIGDNCETKYELLKQFFIKAGIIYGTKKGFPGSDE